MSRTYLMELKVTGYNPDKVQEIRTAISDEWPGWDNPIAKSGVIYAYGESTLSGGEDEEEFQQRVESAIFKANKTECTVEHHDLYVEDTDWSIYDLILIPHALLLRERALI